MICGVVWFVWMVGCWYFCWILDVLGVGSLAVGLMLLCCGWLFGYAELLLCLVCLVILFSLTISLDLVMIWDWLAVSCGLILAGWLVIGFVVVCWFTLGYLAGLFVWVILLVGCDLEWVAGVHVCGSGFELFIVVCYFNSVGLIVFYWVVTILL